MQIMDNQLKLQIIATAAMQALISNWDATIAICDSDPRFNGTNFKEVVAENSVEFAFALIEQLEKNKIL